ncbi:MAG: FUSC family protein [Actinomycetota bacterium]|nr:FUSC family protein [Actinomycetota bacterium]
MDVVWIVLGVVLLLVTLLDAFLAVLNYDEAGLFVDRIVRGQWLLLRAVTRRMGRRWRPIVLRQVTGILILVTILWWVVGIVLGFTFIYLGAMGVSGAFQASTGVTPDFFGALYLSVGQFSTVGVDNIAPGAVITNLLTVGEAMISVVLLSFIITFLVNVYGVIQALQSLSASFFRAGRGVGEPIDTLMPFFPDGGSRGLGGHLDSVLEKLSAYADGLAQNRAAYYFQSGRDQFSLPFSLHMTAGIIGALRWGLPTGSEPSTEPGLIRLTDVYEDFRQRMQQALGWSTVPVPVPVSAQQFASAAAAFDEPRLGAGVDSWVRRFLVIDRRMARLTRSGAPFEVADAYRRYAAWLPFEFQAQSFVAAVSRDLDYQPIYRGIATTADGVPLDVGDDGFPLPPLVNHPAEERPAGRSARRRSRRFGSWIRRRHLFTDPGSLRLAAGLRTLASVTAAIGIIVPLAGLTGSDALYGAVFAGLVALFSGPATMGAGGARRWTGILAAIPAAIGVLLGVFLPRDPVAAIIALALVAALAAWVRRFGARVGGLGQLAFVSYYFTLLLGLDPAHVWGALTAAGVGLVCTWVANLVPGPGIGRQIDGGIAALYERIDRLLDTMIDVVSTGRRDRRLIRTLGAGQLALQNTAGSVGGQLDASQMPGMSPTRAQVLRTCVFDVQLAAENLATLLPLTSSIAMTIEQRAHLSAELLSVQKHLESLRPRRAAAPAPQSAASAPGEWPSDARRIGAAIVALRSAVDRLHQARLTDAASHADENPAARQASAAPSRPAPVGSATDTEGHRDPALAASDRQALQAGISTGLALFLGAFVSSSHQYWAAMPAFQVLSGSDGETRAKGFQRIIATVLGAGIAFGLAILADHSPAVAFPLLVVSVFFVSFSRAVSSVWMVFWQTLVLATMYDVLGVLSVETVQVRVLETAIGAIVAVLVSAVVLPTRTRTRVLRGMADIVRRAGALAERIFARQPEGGAHDGPTEVDSALRDLGGRLNELESEARAIRQNPGSLQRAGIEAQLTSLWSLLSYEEDVARELRRVETTALPAETRQLFGRATADNFAAVQAVLDGDLPLRIHLVDEFDLDPDPGASVEVRMLVLHIERLNQTLLALIEAVKPGTVDAMTTSLGTPGAAPSSTNPDALEPSR